MALEDRIRRLEKRFGVQDPEEARREWEEMVREHSVKVAEMAARIHKRRESGEPECPYERPLEWRSGLEIMAEYVSYGHPEDAPVEVAKALEAHTNRGLRVVPEGEREEVKEVFMWLDREVLPRAFELFGAGSEEPETMGSESMERNKPWP